MTQFWRLLQPEYESDYEHTYINGALEHPYGLPGVKCDVCRQTWGGSRVLPFPCPEALRTRPELQDSWPIDGPHHRALRGEIADHLARDGYAVDLLLPGDAFQPAYLDVPSHPEADFLWASLGSVVVSERIRTRVANVSGGDVAFVPVALRAVGRGSPHDPFPIPATGEPEDIDGEIEFLPNTASAQPFWEMIVLSESGLPRGIADVSACAGCGRRLYDGSARILSMFPEMWRGSPIFTLATTLWIIVTDDLHQQILASGATNVTFRAI
jgi:hypothetical protein